MSIPIVEIIGPPGAGKTTLLKGVIEGSTRGSTFATANKSMCSKKPRKLFKRFEGLAFSWAIRNRILERALLTNDDSMTYSKALGVSSEEWSCFLDFSLGLIKSQDKPWGLKALALKWWLDAFVDRVKIGTTDRDFIVCLDDEPLNYRLSMFDGIEEYKIRRYYELAPLPSAVIFLSIGEVEVMNRIKNRARVAVRHKKLNESALQADVIFSANVAKIAKEVISSRGVPVLEVNSGEDLSVNVASVLTFIDQIGFDGSLWRSSHGK